VPASDRAGAGMRRHVHSCNHAAESFVSFIPLFGRSQIRAPTFRTPHDAALRPKLTSRAS